MWKVCSYIVGGFRADVTMLVSVVMTFFIIMGVFVMIMCLFIFVIVGMRASSMAVTMIMTGAVVSTMRLVNTSYCVHETGAILLFTAR